MVKIYRESAFNPMFPNEPDAETRLLDFLNGQGLAPRLEARLDTKLGTCVVYQHVPGHTWERKPELVARTMRRLHMVEPPKELRKAADGSRQIRQQTYEILTACRDRKELDELCPRGDVPPTQSGALLHGDIVPGNVIVADDDALLIDWQCPAIGDPCEDIAIFLSPAMQSVYRGAPLEREEISRFLEAYGNREIVGRYRKLAPWYHWRMAAYCQWQVEQGCEDYALGRVLELSELQRSSRP